MSTEMVTVGLKHPSGLILRLHEMVEQTEPVMGGGLRKTKRAQFTGQQVRLRGYNKPSDTVAMPSARAEFTYTQVSKDFWEAWVKQNADHPYLKQGILFARAEMDGAQAMGRERGSLSCGLEALDPQRLPLSGIKSYDPEAA